MDNHGNDREIDPEYASNSIAVKRAEKLKEDNLISENINSVEKLKEILNNEFNKDLLQRQNQIEHIEKQIHKTQKLLHLMRYVLISSYYNRKELEYNGSEETAANADTSYLFDQNRIHPAIKKLLGKSTSASDFTIAMCRSARRGKTEHKPNLMVENLNDTSFKNPNLAIGHKSSTNHSVEGSSNLQASQIDRNRQKIKNRIIVGNISKWMPSCEDDNLTHKWMMYVRGPKENPDVSHFIDKVVFYLHPSYKPHDMVEVSEPPFHLSRRGWGEFPIRVQIHFRCTLNKPVDIVHNLKLDKTYSGRQTLGNESIIDLYLYDDKVTDILESDESKGTNFIKVEKKDMKKKHEIIAFTDICEKTELKEEPERELSQDTVPNFEHNYCTEDVKPSTSGININQFNEPINMDHSYCYPATHEFLNVESTKGPPEHVEQEENSLIHGLDESYVQTNEELTKKEPLYYRKTLVYTSKQSSSKNNLPSTSQSCCKVVGTKRKPQEGLLKTMFTNKISSQLAPANSVSYDIEVKQERNDNNITENNDMDKFQIALPRRRDLNTSKFKNIGEALPYLFKRFPLVSELAENSKYSSLYPFTALSMNEYFSWNVAKQSSAEWSRAKVIKNIITKEDIHDHQNWNTKAILIYGRSHGYTPMANYISLEKNIVEIKLINACFKTSVDLPFNPQLYNIEPSVDIDSVSPEKKRSRLSTINISDPTCKMQCSYIREEALECGVVLKNEHIEDNIIFNGAEMMIFEAVKCLANHLVRRSLHHAISDGNYGSSNDEIKSRNVEKALKDRKELEALDQFRIRQTNMKFFLQ